ncbi:hypothetical protein H5410_049312 [Solanum commersonii]|uniref:Uncharacterized protein n=1 Tax=Solanum commersonii TaxID=4109 RepID=A0A9J5WTT7_SOLCO|nr:hypothetical protein H5410_049312 [Solanum commersonii]
MEPVGFHGLNGPFTRSNEPQSRATWTSAKTLAIEPVGHHGQNGPFTRSNSTTFYDDPKLRCQFCQKLTWTSVKILAMDLRHCQNNPFTNSNKPRAGKPPILPIFVCYTPRHFVVTQNSDVIFANNLNGPLVLYSTTFYGEPKFQRNFCQKPTWTSVKTLAMEPGGCYGQNGSFTRSNEPRAGKPRILLIFMCYSP